MLLKMLLEPSLPVAALLSSEDAVLLHKALYDAVMMVDYSFCSGSWVQSPDSHSKSLALSWALAADRAIQFARATADQARAISYLNAFCESHLVAELTKWIRIQAGTVDQNTGPDISSPKALIKWLLVLEDQGIRVFDHSIWLLHQKAVICMSGAESDSPELLHRKNLNHNSFDCNKTDVNEDKEMGTLSYNGSPGSVCLMNAKIDAGRKRKESLNGCSHETRAKQVKRSFCGSSLGEKFLPFHSDNGFHCGSEIKNVASDEDMELIG